MDNINLILSMELADELSAEFSDHSTILDQFRDLPKVLKKYILTFYRTERRVGLCPICGSGMYASAFMYSVPPFCHFTCYHNYSPVPKPNKEEE